MNRLDLDISKYSDSELREIFDIDKDSDQDQTRIQLNNYKSSVAIDSNLSLLDKDKIAQFVDKAVNKLCGSLDKMYIGSKKQQTFTSPINDMIQATPPNHFLIENPNVLADRNAKIYEGKNVNFNEYPPGYMNTINIKTIKKTLNVDSRFRDSYYSTLSTDFHVDLPDTFRKVVNLQLSSFEIPLTAYSINSYNNCFTIDNSNIDISYGNYVTPFTAGQYSDASANIITMINDAITSKVPDITYTINSISGKSVFTNTGSDSYTIYFNRDCSGENDLDTPLPLKLGWLLGFRVGSYTIDAGESISSEGIAAIASPKYIYICINDFTNAGNYNFVAAFNESTLSSHIIARIQYQHLIQRNGQHNFGIDDDTLYATREYFGPVDIQKLHLQILDEYGRVVDFNNMDWSCTITFDILYD